MLTAQMYASGGAPTTAPTPFEPSAGRKANAIVRPLYGSHEPPRYGEQPPHERLAELLSAGLLPYVNLLTVITLLRGLLPEPNPPRPAHYALLLRQEHIVGLVSLEGDGEDYEDYRIFIENANHRRVIQAALALEADAVLFVTALADPATGFGRAEMQEVDDVARAYERFCIDLIDWLFFFPGRNVSYYLDKYGPSTLEEGVTIEALTHHAISTQA